LLVCLAAASLCSLIFAASASALPFTVNTNSTDTGDATPGNGVCEVHTGGGDCTLDAAMEETSATVAADTIDFSVPGPFTLFSAKAINNPLTIDGNGSGVAGTVVQGRSLIGNNPDTHPLFTAGAAVTFKDLRLVDGGRTTGGTGGAVTLGASTTFDNVTLTGNQITGNGQGVGGAIYANNPAATTTLINSTVSGNSVTSAANDALAGGIYSAGPLNLTDSTVNGNTIAATPGVALGGGIYAEGAFNIVRSAITLNTAAADTASPLGGGIYSADGAGTRAITNSTISGNSMTISATDAFGGGLRVTRDATINSSTFANNTADGGADIFVDQAPTVTVKNTILASTAGGGACLQNNPMTLFSAVPGNNIDIGTSCGFGTANGNKQNTNPLLGSLALNAPGTTQTHAITSSSPAFNAATADCGGLGTDQRGVLRPQPTGGPCDVGAFEIEVPTPMPITPAATTPASTPITPTKKRKCKKKKGAAAAKKCKKRK